MTWGRPVTDADGDRYRALFADLTPEEVAHAVSQIESEGT